MLFTKHIGLVLLAAVCCISSVSAKKRQAAAVPVPAAASVADTVIGTRDFVFLPYLFGADTAGNMIALGNLVAERDAAFFTADLLATYKILRNDVREFDRLLLRCGGNWGATAYVLALQAAARKPMANVWMAYDRMGQNWEAAAVRLGVLYPGSMQPTYTFGLYLERQQRVWRRLLEEPFRWRKIFLGL